MLIYELSNKSQSLKLRYPITDCISERNQYFKNEDIPKDQRTETWKKEAEKEFKRNELLKKAHKPT